MTLDRRHAVRAMLADRNELLVVSGLGSPTYDVAAAGDDPRNFHLWGAMGGAAMVGLGVALARPERRVLVVTGDGEMLMGLGSLATIGVKQPRNLGIVVLDNGLYGETGRQPSHTSGPVDLARVARGCGFAEAFEVADEPALARLAARVREGDGLFMAVVKIADGDTQRVLPTRDGAALKLRFRAAIGVVE
jgi:thiamine pyrophosphate-dependent acetolactate synthase large subunit-like protein